MSNFKTHISFGIVWAVIISAVAVLSGALTPRLFFAAAVAGGYLSHLILDEIYSVDITGLKIKSSFGSAVAFTGTIKNCNVTSIFYFNCSWIAMHSDTLKIIFQKEIKWKNF